MRRYVRHPSTIPIELSVDRQRSGTSTQLQNVGAGGIACAVEKPLPVGSTVQLRIPLVWPEYKGCGVVVWCRQQASIGGFEVGIEFDAQEAFKSKMVEQLCQIEEYRQQVLNDQGRALDGEQAAREWIGQHAGEFSDSLQGNGDDS
jgi:hypothetical protein